MANIVKRQQTDQLPAILSPAAEAYLRAALSDNTQRAYRAQIVRWTEWCAEKGGKAWPADLVVVVNYLSERADAGQAVSTIRTAVAAIKFAHEAQGLPFNRPSYLIAVENGHKASGTVRSTSESCLTGFGRNGPCVTSIAGPNGDA